MTLAKVNEYVEKRIAELEKKERTNAVIAVLYELNNIHIMTSQIQSLTSQEPKMFSDTNINDILKS